MKSFVWKLPPKVPLMRMSPLLKASPASNANHLQTIAVSLVSRGGWRARIASFRAMRIFHFTRFKYVIEIRCAV